ncbi:MAG: hypothetical protein BWY43_00025 [candidate division WS2 bacterium ADurb.Bin280]|uniref:Uncharacterized protein n=1 Tax=candidate division WS2 bacterium ADurb.Bin280 TaxID=1852829 RepID=A0A1V5SG00_9BACT|nr:MAG: hypothetical protein BWY43_00025 [candidate division WS2 bacterium ADurb.Bin280]
MPGIEMGTWVTCWYENSRGDIVEVRFKVGRYTDSISELKESAKQACRYDAREKGWQFVSLASVKF